MNEQTKTANPSSATQTQTITVQPPESVVVKIRKGINVKWADDTVDNEHMGRKSSKKCCIFHKPKAFGESSSESSSDSDSDSSGGNEGARPSKKKKQRKKHRHHHHEHGHAHDHECGDCDDVSIPSSSSSSTTNNRIKGIAELKPKSKNVYQ
eukprot:m.54299 g.54299  ORF g.54299 m.54299 type:complete len:152 (-) comp7714_c1_seq1:52-507(-)